MDDQQKKALTEEGASILNNIFPSPILAGEHLEYHAATFFGNRTPLDFVNANVKALPFGINQEERKWLPLISRYHHPLSCQLKTAFSLEDVARRILEEETKFDLSRYNIHVSTEGAIGTFHHLLENLVSPEKPLVLYASPNWIFDTIVGQVPGAVGQSFHATSSDEFLEGFKAFSDLDKVSAIFVVDPSNPLGYRFNRSQIKDLEKISSSHGIVPIFDDVFRGLQKKGERHSASEYSGNSIVVETTSKRFTGRGMGVSWTLIPKELSIKGSPLQLPRNPCPGCENYAALIIKALYETNHDTRVADFIEGNAQAFRDGFNSFFKDPLGKFYQAFPSMPVMTYFLEKGSPVSYALSRRAQDTILVTDGIQWICQPQVRIQERANEVDFGSTYLRICPTKEFPERSYLAGETLAYKLKLMTLCEEDIPRI